MHDELAGEREQDIPEITSDPELEALARLLKGESQPEVDPAFRGQLVAKLLRVEAFPVKTTGYKGDEVIRIIRVMEENAKKKLPAYMTPEDVYGYLNGEIPLEDIAQFRRSGIVFCADCEHIFGMNPEGCTSCERVRYANSRFRLGW